MSKKIVAISLIITLLAVFLTGCTVEDMQQRELNRSGIWGSFVGILSDMIDNIANAINSNENIYSYGLSILIVTVIIRFITLPFMLKQLKSTRAMQKIQPEMDALKEKYKTNQEKLNQETMKLFQKHNVNPMAGCLPLFVQMPILIAFYQSIMYNEHIRAATFLFFELGQKDGTYILPVLAAATTFLQQKTTMVSGNNNPQLKMMLYFMPFMILFISSTLPSALSLYWFYGNIFSIVQNLFLYRDSGQKQEGAS